MKKVIILLFFLGINCYSQNDVLRVDYNFNLSIGQYQEYQSTLYVNNKSSLFLWNKPYIEKTEEDENNISINLNALDSIGAFSYKDISKDSLFSRIIYFKKEILLLKEQIPKIDWNILSEEKKIGSYNCQKAITNFRGRDYIVWFTKEIPINAGPWKLQGLPGLILAAYDTLNEIQFVVSSISKSDYKINPLLEADRIISLDEYKAIAKSSPQDFAKRLKAKLPRGVKIEVKSKQGMEKFD